MHAGIVNQQHIVRVLRLVTFNSGKYSAAELEYDSYDPEQLAIVETLNQSLHYLDRTHYNGIIWCHHQNVEYLQTLKVLSQRQAWWSEIPLAHNCVIEHVEGNENCINGSYRLPHYEMFHKRLVV